MTQKRPYPRISVHLRLEPEELELIDRCRMSMNRTDFIRGALRLRCADPSIKRALAMLQQTKSAQYLKGEG